MSLSRVVMINDASQARGGATGLAVQLSHLLLERGIDVTFFCGDDGLAPDLIRAGATLVAAGRDKLLSRSALDAATRGLRDTNMRDLLARHIAEHDTPGTVYHVHGWAQILSPAIFEALQPVAARTFIHAHDMFLACPNGVYMDYRRREICTRRPLSLSCLSTHCDKRSRVHKAWRVLRQLSLHRSLPRKAPWAGVLAIHPAMLDALARAGYPREILKLARNPATAFSTNRVPAEDNTALYYIGRLERDKGVIDLAQSAARVGMPLIFVGEGVMRPELERDFPQFQITGWQDRATLGGLVQKARALVIPSRHPEPFGLVIAEAVQSGLPVAVADTALLASEVVDHGLGTTFDVYDPESLDTALRRIRDLSVDEMRAMSTRGFASAGVLANTAEGWVDQLIEGYTGALHT